QVWNANIAFAYPCLTTNADDEVGISISWGGGQDYGSHAVGILGDFVVWYGEESQATATFQQPVKDAAGNVVKNPDGTTKMETVSRWGDYVHVRLAHPDTRFFSAFGYAVVSNAVLPSTTNSVDYLYVEFGR